MKKIAEIRNILQVIQLQVAALRLDLCDNALYKLDLIVKQVKRIDKILLELLKKAENP